MKKVLYIRPSYNSKTGIRKYSNVFMNAFNKYSSGSHRLTDVNEIIAPNLSRMEIKHKVKELSRQGFFKSYDLSLTEIGLNEDREFFILHHIKLNNIHISSYVVLHDAPRVIVNLFPFFKKGERYYIVRAIRYVFNKYFGRFIENRFFNDNHKFITLSSSGKKALSGRNVKATFIPLMNFYDYDLKSKKFHKNINETVIGFCGFISYHKGLDLLVDAAIILLEKGEKLKFLVAGEAIDNKSAVFLKKIKDKVKNSSYKDSFEFLGYLEEQKMPDFFQSIDILALPYRATKTSSSSGPLKWARSFGVPVIASNTEVFIESVEDKVDGFLFQEGSVSDLELVMLSMIKSYDVKLIEAAVKKATETSQQNVISFFEKELI